jgi:hypothetical protein
MKYSILQQKKRTTKEITHIKDNSTYGHTEDSPVSGFLWRKTWKHLVKQLKYNKWTILHITNEETFFNTLNKHSHVPTEKVKVEIMFSSIRNFNDYNINKTRHHTYNTAKADKETTLWEYTSHNYYE